MNTDKTKPNLFIIGAPKCGTSALAAYLDQHPEVYISKPKEPFYWSFDYPEAAKVQGIGNLTDYLNLFRKSEPGQRCVGEGSTNYLHSGEAIRRILDFQPAARFIVMLRNPVEVAHAYHSEQWFAHWEDDPDFESAWNKRHERGRGRLIPAACPDGKFLDYGSIANFAPQIRRLFQLVPPAQRKVILFDDFKRDTKSVFDETVRFLELPPDERTEFEKVNAAHVHRFPGLSRMILDPPAPLRPAMTCLRGFLRRFQGGMVSRLKNALRKKQNREPLSDKFREQLIRYFTPGVRELSALLGRDLTHWTGSCLTTEQTPNVNECSVDNDSSSAAAQTTGF